MAILINKNMLISVTVSLKVFAKDPIDNKSVLIQVIAFNRYTAIAWINFDQDLWRCNRSYETLNKVKHFS